MSLPAWMEYAWVTITPKGGANLEVASRTRDISINMGSKDVEIVNVNTGQFLKRNRRELVEITFDDVIPLFGDVWDASFEGQEASGDNISIDASLSRKQFRIVILWTDTDPSTITSATQAIQPGNNARRLVFEDFEFTGWEQNWRDLLLTGGATFKGVAVDMNGNAKVKIESCTSSSSTGLSALGSY